MICMSMSVILPIIICTQEGLAQFIIPVDDGVSGKAIIAFTIIFFISHHGVGSAPDMGGSVGLGEEQHVGMQFIAFDQDVIADNGACLPCYMEFARRTVGRSEATCLAAGISVRNEAAHGALER